MAADIDAGEFRSFVASMAAFVASMEEFKASVVQRFDAMDQRFDAMQAETKASIDQLTDVVRILATKQHERFNAVERKIDGQPPLTLMP